MEEGGRRRLDMHGTALPHDGQLPDISRAVAVLRPHVLTVCAPENGILAGVVHRRAFLGNAVEAGVRLDSGPMVFVEMRPGGEGNTMAQAGARVGLRWRSCNLRVFPA